MHLLKNTTLLLGLLFDSYTIHWCERIVHMLLKYVECRTTLHAFTVSIACIFAVGQPRSTKILA